MTPPKQCENTLIYLDTKYKLYLKYSPLVNNNCMAFLFSLVSKRHL